MCGFQVVFGRSEWAPVILVLSVYIFLGNKYKFSGVAETPRSCRQDKFGDRRCEADVRIPSNIGGKQSDICLNRDVIAYLSNLNLPHSSLNAGSIPHPPLIHNCTHTLPFHNHAISILFRLVSPRHFTWPICLTTEFPIPVLPRIPLRCLVGSICTRSVSAAQYK
jgi:hypothetical protein